MDILIQTDNDQYSVFGIRYFISKYGFSEETFAEKLHLNIIKRDTHLDPNHHIDGWAEWKGVRLPVLVPPSPIPDQGTPLLSYSNGSDKYPCAIITDDNIIISLDIFRHIGLFLSGQLEKTWNLIKADRKEIVLVPFVDCYSDFLFSCIQTVFNREQRPLISKSFWPEGKPFAVCLTHDVDEIKKTYQWITRPWNHMKKCNVHGLYNQYLSFKQKVRGKEPYWTFEPLMRMEEQLGVKSSFYFLNETGIVRITDRKTWRHSGRRYDWNSPQVKNLMKKMESEGWEVGLHGSFFSYLDHEKICSEKKALENALGISGIIGVRQHNLNIKFPDTWIGQEKCGLLYDTTLGYNDCMGFRWGTCLPFRPWIDDEKRVLNLIEIPLTIEDLPFFENGNRREDTLKLIERIKNNSGVLTLLWHHSAFDDHEYPGWGSAYKRIVEYCKKRDAWIGSAKQIFEWWAWREKITIDWEYDGSLLKILPAPKDRELFIKIYLPDTFKIGDVKNATLISCDQNEWEIKTNILPEEEFVHIDLSQI
jgi:hypothetical protein